MTTAEPAPAAAITVGADVLEGVRSAQGIDVSDWQGQYDWAAAKKQVAGLQFGIYRLTQGLGGSGTASPDPDAAWNHGQIAAQGLVRGAYHFLDPRVGGAPQAAYMVARAHALGPVLATDMFWLDNETAGASPAAVSACARDFMAELDKLVPHNPRGVYTFIDFAREGNCAGLGNRWLWLAYPNLTAPAPPPPWLGPKFAFWQWGTRRGADTDAFMGTSAEFAAWVARFAPKPPPPPDEVHCPAGAWTTLPHGDEVQPASHDVVLRVRSA
jgi:GH25 family lysozyme M1 (1,4-beta-N-acetylmuramidase)